MTTQKVMLNVCIALLPACIAGSVIFGIRAALVLLTCVVSCVMFEYICRLMMKKENTISDLSAVVTGLLLGMNLPATIPLWLCIIGSFVAIAIVKQLFGGLGQNFANPAIVARIVLLLAAGARMTTWAVPFYYKNGADVVTSATPLAAKWLEFTSGGAAYTAPPFTMSEMLLGVHGGCIGETASIALLIGGLYLMIRRIITPTTPVAFVGVFALLTLIRTGSLMETLYQVLAGGLLLGALFMATDYATTPITEKGKLIFGIGCAVITFLIRQFGTFPEGVSFSILLMNILTPYIDRLTAAKPLGAKLPESKKEAKA